MMDHSSQVTDDTPDTNMEDLFDSKDRDEESTTGATVSCYTACDGSEENDLPVFKETTIYRRRFKARFEDGRAEEGSLSNTERDDEDDYRNYEASRRRTANTSSLYESYVERLSDDTDGQKNQDLKLVRTAINYVRVLEEERSPIFAVLERDLPYGSQKRDNGPQIKWADVGLEVKFFNAETELNLDGTLVAENMTKEGTYTSLRGPKTLIRVLYDRTEEHAREPPHITDGEQPDPEQVVLLAMGLTSEPIAKFFKKKLDLETDNTFLVRFSKPFRPLLRSLQPLREQLAKLEEKFK
ncbi:hypothetical protein BDZ45DRAFT_267710 [Acephala macrosclerotiorum]|nr:hypothetical protein BDZ45DRAFT_267710 [Acephala macrosclerotiorum]